MITTKFSVHATDVCVIKLSSIIVITRENTQATKEKKKNKERILTVIGTTCKKKIQKIPKNQNNNEHS